MYYVFTVTITASVTAYSPVVPEGVEGAGELGCVPPEQ